jgi:hypothetical protein
MLDPLWIEFFLRDLNQYSQNGCIFFDGLINTYNKIDRRAEKRAQPHSTYIVWFDSTCV